MIWTVQAALLLTLSVMFCLTARADETAEIVTSCHYANAEWGAEAIDRCIKENQALRQQVLQYPSEHSRIVERCRQRSEWGWDWVKKCVDADIQAQSALAAYPQEKAGLIAACRAEFGHQGHARVKACVDRASEPDSRGKN